LNAGNYIFITIFTAIIGLSVAAQAQGKTWSERKLSKTIVSIDKDLQRKRWEKVIKRSQEALGHCVLIHNQQHTRCITLLRNINSSYEKMRRFNPKPEQIKQAYVFAKNKLGEQHFSTAMSRNLYYKYLLFTEEYLLAIPLAHEIVTYEEKTNSDPIALLERQRQLYALYGLTEQFEYEERILAGLLSLTADLLGEGEEDYIEVALALAENYCVQKKYHEFFELVAAEKLDIKCEL